MEANYYIPDKQELRMRAEHYQYRIDAFLATQGHDPLMGRINATIAMIPPLIVHNDMSLAEIAAWRECVMQILADPNLKRPINTEDNLDPLNIRVFLDRIPKDFPPGLPFDTQNDLIIYRIRAALDAYKRHKADVKARRKAESEA
jgi:hypothetical protein